MKNGITTIIDFFYPPFKKLMPLQTFRYAACGGGNMVLGFVIFTAVYHLVSTGQATNANAAELELNIGFMLVKAHSFALSCSSTIVFITGFLLNKYVVFTGSNLKGRVQLFRYFLACLSSFCINYLLLNALVLYLHVYPVLAQIIVTAIVVTISFFMQQYFTFKIKATPQPGDVEEG